MGFYTVYFSEREKEEKVVEKYSSVEGFTLYIFMKSFLRNLSLSLRRFYVNCTLTLMLSRSKALYAAIERLGY